MKNFIDLAFPKESADNYYQNQTKAAVDNFMYIEKEWFEKIFEPSTYYILGSKGGGKTLYATYMCAHVRKNTLSKSYTGVNLGLVNIQSTVVFAKNLKCHSIPPNCRLERFGSDWSSGKIESI